MFGNGQASKNNYDSNLNTTGNVACKFRIIQSGQFRVCKCPWFLQGCHTGCILFKVSEWKSWPIWQLLLYFKHFAATDEFGGISYSNIRSIIIIKSSELSRYVQENKFVTIWQHCNYGKTRIAWHSRGAVIAKTLPNLEHLINCCSHELAHTSVSSCVYSSLWL